MKIKYTPNLYIESNGVGNGGSTCIHDLNMSADKQFWKHPLSAGVQQSNFNSIPKNHYCSKSYELGNNLCKYIKKYSVSGRLTVLRAIYNFLSFQAQKGFELGKRDGVAEWCSLLKSQVFTKVYKDKTASSMLNMVSKFLISQGELGSQYTYTFSNASKAHEANAKYTTEEFNLALHLLMNLQKTYEKELEHLTERIKEGKALASNMTNDRSIFFREMTLNIKGTEYTYDVGLFNLIRTYNLLSFLIFIFYTIASKKQITELLESEIFTNTDGGIETNYKFKGRAFKFVRYGIGASITVDFERSGVKWFERYLNTRKAYLECLETSGIINNSPYLFHQFNNTGSSVGFNHHWWKIQQEYIEIPRFSARAIKKSSEQLLDSLGQDPLLTTGKAQHEWETYQRNYSQGNEIDMMKNFSNALNIMVTGGTSSLPIEQRQQIANKKGIKLVSPDDNSYISSAHGLGCKTDDNETKQQRDFFREQESQGRTPKVCANILECLKCDKCGIIDQESNLYELLSFRQSILLNKVFYSGSTKGSEQYEKIVNGINERLTLVDQAKLAAAQKKITNDGVSDVWKITI
jgi:hypothetical protein